MPDPLTQSTGAQLWSKDRGNLVTCKQRHGALVGATEARDAIQGAAVPETGEVTP